MTASSVIALPVLSLLRHCGVSAHDRTAVCWAGEIDQGSGEAVMAGNKQIILVTQTEAEIEDRTPNWPLYTHRYSRHNPAIAETARWCSQGAC